MMLKPQEEKEKVYWEIDALIQKGVERSIKEDESGFPAVTVDCGDIHILTDILSLEEWWAKKKQVEGR